MKHIGAVLSGLVVVLAAGFSGQAEAAIHQCREGGRMTYQALPCAGQSADLGVKGRRGHGQALDEAQALADEPLATGQRARRITNSSGPAGVRWGSWWWVMNDGRQRGHWGAPPAV